MVSLYYLPPGAWYEVFYCGLTVLGCLRLQPDVPDVSEVLHDVVLDVRPAVVLDVLPAEDAGGARDVDDDGLAGLGRRGCDGDQDGCGVLAVLVLCEDPELPAVPSLGGSNPQTGLALCRLYLDVLAGTDRLVVKKPSYGKIA